MYRKKYHSEESNSSDKEVEPQEVNCNVYNMVESSSSEEEVEPSSIKIHEYVIILKDTWDNYDNSSHTILFFIRIQETSSTKIQMSLMNLINMLNL